MHRRGSQSFWKGYENPTQQELEEWLNSDTTEIRVGKSAMYYTFSKSPMNAWMYAIAPIDLLDLYWIWGHQALKSIPPKSFLKFILRRLEDENHRTDWKMKRMTDFLEMGKSLERYESLLKKHPWDITPDDEIHELSVNSSIQKEWKRKSEEIEAAIQSARQARREKNEREWREKMKPLWDRKREKKRIHEKVRKERADWFYNKGGKEELERMVAEGKLRVRAWERRG